MPPAPGRDDHSIAVEIGFVDDDFGKIDDASALA
jgi:hypothetical protein